MFLGMESQGFIAAAEDGPHQLRGPQSPAAQVPKTYLLDPNRRNLNPFGIPGNLGPVGESREVRLGVRSCWSDPQPHESSRSRSGVEVAAIRTRLQSLQQRGRGWRNFIRHDGQALLFVLLFFPTCILIVLLGSYQIQLLSHQDIAVVLFRNVT